MKQQKKNGIPCNPGGWNWLFMQEPKQPASEEAELSEEQRTIIIRWDEDDSAQAVQDVEPQTTAK